MIEFGLEQFGESALVYALDEFMTWTDEELSEDDLADHEPLFFPWFLFNWEYEEDPELPQLDGPEEITIAELFAADKKNRQNHLEAQIIEATARQPYSFYEIQEVYPGEGYRLRDIFCGTVSKVTEHKGSEYVCQGQILFGRVVQIDTVAMLIGCGNILIPPQMKPALIDFRQTLAQFYDPIDFDALYDYDIELRQLYLDIYSAVTEPPELQNTDEDSMLLDADELLRDAGAVDNADVSGRSGLDKPDSNKAGAGTKADRIAEVAGKIEAFGRARLDPEHTILSLRLCDKIGRMRKLSIQRGRAEIWAAAILHVIARLNFLFDPNNDPHISTDDLNAFFETKKSTVGNKAAMIQKAAGIFMGDPYFSSEKIVDMFRFYETENGFVIPGSMLDNWENQRETEQSQPAVPVRPTFGSAPEPSRAPAKKPVKKRKEKKDADDRQLKLFDDE